MNTRSLPQALAAPMIAAAIGLASLIATPGCATAPKQEDRADVVADSRAATQWFRRNVSGLSDQLGRSGGYITFPGIGQYGILIGGGEFGRGVVYNRIGDQIGWAYINEASAGLQVGAQGYKMMMVLEDEATFRRFQENQLAGNVQATVVAAESGTSGTASFTNGVAVYKGGQTGLMAGVNVGLEYIRYESLGGS
jgi:lipid-binding SYLF domain-containing protein